MSLYLVAGLGNPGDKYKETRHNAGFMVVEDIADFFSISLDKKKFDAVFGRGFIEGTEVILAKPMAFMNLSGFPVYNTAAYFRISSKNMLIIHDDIDLAFGTIKIKEKGGHGGHNGIRSIKDAFGGEDFPRLRIGVGRSETGTGVTGHVLGKFDIDEKEILSRIIKRSRDAVVTFLCKGAKEAMNCFNNKHIVI